MKGNVMTGRSTFESSRYRFVMMTIMLAGLLFWGVQDSMALKSGRADEKEHADKKSKLSALKEWKSKNTPVVPGVLIVKFKSTVKIDKGAAMTSHPLLNAQLQRAGVTRLTPVVPVMNRLASVNAAYRLDRLYYADLKSGTNEFEAAETLMRDVSVEYAEPKRIHYLSYIPGDPLYAGGSPGPQNGYFGIMKIPQAWDIIRADSSSGGLIPKNQRVIIAVVDGGTMWEHQDLKENIYLNAAEDRNGNGVWDTAAYPSGDRDGIDQDGDGFVDNGIGWNFANDFWNPRGAAATPLSADHGTACASYFGAVTKNGLGMAGTAFNPRILPVGAGHTSVDRAVYYGYEGILYAAEQGAGIISCSWGGAGGYSNFEQDVISAVTDAGSLVLGASGNGGSDDVGDNNDLIPNYPSNYYRVLAVGATSKTSDAKASFSNYGTTVPVYAVGVNVVSCVDAAGGATYQSTNWSGTSMSTPMVAGLAGLLKTKNPSWTPDQIRTQIRVTSDSIDAVTGNTSYAGKLGHGRVNFYRALTESRPGLDMISSQAVTSSGENVIFLPGDTIRLSAVFKNVLFADANNVTITVSPSGSQVTVIQNPPVISSVAAGMQKTMSPALLRVDPSLSAITTIFLKISVSADGNYRDAFGITITVYPALPNWSSQISPVGALLSVDAADANVVWAVGNGGAITRTTDGGSNWEFINSGIIGAQDLYNVEAVDANTAFTTSSSSSTYIYRTTDGGASWQQVFTQSGGFINAIHMFDAVNGVAQGDPVGNWTILRTTDGGASWYRTATEPVPASGEAGWNNSMHWIGTRHGWFGTNKTKIWRTTNGGTTWISSATTGITSTTSLSFSDTLNGLAGNGDNSSKTTYMRTTNGGAAWFTGALPAATTDHHVVCTPNSAYAWCATASGKMYRSVANNVSLTWQTQIIPSVSGTVVDFSVMDTSSGWAVTSAGEILEVGTYVAVPVITSVPDTTVMVNHTYQYNAGASGIPAPVYRLTEYPTGMTIDSVSGMIQWTPDETGNYWVILSAVNDLGTSTQIYPLHVLPDVGVDDPNQGLPDKFALAQNFPNPFNPLTAIRYSVRDRSKVTLTVYNLLGQEVRTLVDEMQEPGYRQVQWDGRDHHGRTVSSGLYLYRLRAGNFVQTKKMILMK